MDSPAVDTSTESVEVWYFLPNDWLRQYKHNELDVTGCGARRAIDALRHAQGTIACRGQINGIDVRDIDIIIFRGGTILWTKDAEQVLQEFSRWCALQVAHLWEMPEIVRRYLETGDESISDAAMDAARTARAAAWAAETAEAAARAAAWAAETAEAAARAAAWAAAEAAEAAAWAAEAATRAAAEAAAEAAGAAGAAAGAAVEAAAWAAGVAAGVAAAEAAGAAARADQNEKLEEMLLGLKPALSDKTGTTT